MAQPLGAVVAVVEAELTTPQRPTAVCKGAERLAEMVKVERQAEVAKVERLAEMAKVERLAEMAKVERLAEVAKVERLAEMAKVALRVQVVVVAVVAKIRNCLTFQILRLAMVMVSLTGAVLNLMAISALLGHRPLLVQGARVRKI